jgi:hypothetical protein
MNATSRARETRGALHVFPHERPHDRFTAHLAAHHIGFLHAHSGTAARFIPVQYRAERLQLLCVLPRWADRLYHLAAQPSLAVVLAIPDAAADSTSWLEYRGTAKVIGTTTWRDWTTSTTVTRNVDGDYVVLAVTPEQLAFIDGPDVVDTLTF